jgi:two-component system, NtrC family, sensor kinase
MGEAGRRRNRRRPCGKEALVARPWRLRHKLVFGLTLVVGSVALLLGGTLFGLSSSDATMRATRRKLDEMQIVVQLRDYIHQIGATNDHDRIAAHVRDARNTLAAYRTTVENFEQNYGSDPDGGEDERVLVSKLEAAFNDLDDALQRTKTGIVSAEPNLPPIQQDSVRTAYFKLIGISTNLFSFLIHDVERAHERSFANHRRSLSIAGSASVLAVVVIVTLLYYFRVWVFTPVKSIQAGVQRVHAGNFDQPIVLQSQDELQELADEFNAMTARLRDVYKDLARQVDERSKQLVAAEKMVSVGFLAAGVAHEINNPLASIAFCAEALERRLEHLLETADPADAGVIRKYLGMIQQEAFRCKLITERLLDYSRTGSGRWEPTDLAALVQNVLELVQHLPASRGKRIVFRPDARVVAAADANELQGLVNNLVVNALENMDDGGTVQIGLRAVNETAELSVRDTGCGMSADVLQHIFEPFYTRSRTGKGTGLGLFISQRVATQHGGTITATSDGPGKGSTFTVRFPLRKEGVAANDPPPNVLTMPMRPVAAAA